MNALEGLLAVALAGGAAGGATTFAAAGAEPRAVRASGAGSGSALAVPLVSGGERPTLILAQRVIDRSWGPSDDSTYVETDIPDWRSEGIAFALSAAVPGVGQAYVGERSGLWFALAEVTGWIARKVYRNRGDDLRDRAAQYVGSPSDSASAWSFERWEETTGRDPSEIRAIYSADREAFYDLIASDPGYVSGWTSTETRAYFSGLREHSEARFRYARYTSVGLWVNHVAAAVHALRAARLHNLPLGQGLQLKLESGWQQGSPTLSASLERKF